MRLLVVILLASLALAFVAADVDREMQQLIKELATTFSITEMEAMTCVRRWAVTPRDAIFLSYMLFLKDDSYKDTVRRLSCALTCCAQAHGMMTGSKLELGVLQKILRETGMPPRMKYLYEKFIFECAEMVKDITDACDVGLEFVKCLITKSKNVSL